MTSGPDITHTAWKANFPDAFHWAEWDTEENAVLFHEGSGETLMLTPMGAFILKTISINAISTGTLAEQAAQYFDIPLDDKLTGAIRMILRTFEQKGLVLSTLS